MDSPDQQGQPERQLTFRTDEQLAGDLAIVVRDLRQCANGVRHLEALIPALARAIDNNVALLESVQAHLAGTCEQAA